MEQWPQNETTTEQVPEMQPSESQNKEAEQVAADATAAAAQIRVMELSSRLFEYAMKDQWKKVMEEYKSNPDCHVAKITEAEDTALHLAVSGGKLEVVYSMVEVLDKQKEKEKDYVSKVLKAKNKRGNTLLHTAAALGNAHMCHCMGSKDPNLIAERNIKNETPFFCTAQFGHKDALLCLYFCYPAENRGDLCRSRNENGETILHTAISGEQFGIPVDQLKENKYEYDSNGYLKRLEDNGNNGRRPSFPQNYKTCERFFQVIFGVVFYGMLNLVETCSFGGQSLSYINDKNNKSKSISDEENPQGSSKTSQGDPSSSIRSQESNTSNGALSDAHLILASHVFSCIE
ncbi:hypothetical protein PTKIN_Ptkin09bG0225200 [Pterospermum kingtungense]